MPGTYHLFTALFIPLLTLHLLSINLAAAGPAVAVWVEWRGRRRGDLAAETVARKLSWDCLWAFLIGTALGGALLAEMWRRGDPFMETFLRLTPAKLWFAGGELVFYLVCLGGYLALWTRPWRQTLSGRVVHRLLAVLAATNLLYHFPPLLVALASLAEQSAFAPDVIDAASLRRIIASPEVASRSVHHILAAIALAGVHAVGLGWRAMRRGGDQQSVGGVRSAAWIALVASTLQVPVGAWVLLSFTQSRALMGTNLLATCAFIAGVLIAFYLLQQLAAIAFGDISRRTVVATMIAFTATVLLMIAAMILSRGSPSSSAEERAAADSAVSLTVRAESHRRIL